MRRVIYTSQSRLEEKLGELDKLVEQASILNNAVGITGMLWADGGRFVQVLEGDEDAVSDTLKRIGNDPRHNGMEIFCDRGVVHRMFGTWGMVRPDEGPQGTASTAFLVGLVAVNDSPTAKIVYDMLLNS